MYTNKSMGRFSRRHPLPISSKASFQDFVITNSLMAVKMKSRLKEKENRKKNGSIGMIVLCQKCSV